MTGARRNVAAGRAVRLAYDRVALAPVALAPALPRPVLPCRAARREMGVKAALEWAFGVERVRLNFDALDRGEPCETDTIWRLMQRGRLGCRVDGGGWSAGHADAEIIASFVARLPVAHGGRSMAVTVAALARAGAEPDWMRDARVRCVPRGWARANQFGRNAETELVEVIESEHRGRRIRREVRCCPVTYTPSAAQIAAARREWLAWWGALLHLGHELRTVGGLASIAITQGMPPLSPWNTRG